MALDLTTDVQVRIIAAVAAEIEALQLPGVAKVYTRLAQSDDDLMFPAVVVSDLDQREQVVGGTKFKEWYAHPAYVLFRTNDAHDSAAVVDGQEVSAPDLVRYWRGAVIRHFQSRPLAAVPEVLYCEVKPAEIGQIDRVSAEVLKSGLLVRAITHENRG